MTILKESKGHTLVSLVLIAKQHFRLSPSEIGVILANNVRGEEKYVPEKWGNSYIKYHNFLAEKLRDKLFSILQDIEKKGKEIVLYKQRSELEKNISEMPTQTLNWWYTIWYTFQNKPPFYRNKSKYTEKNSKNLEDSFNDLFKFIYDVLVNNVANEIYKDKIDFEQEENSFVKKIISLSSKSYNNLSREYSIFITKLLNISRGHEKLK